KIGSSGRRVVFKDLKVSGSRDKVDPVQPFRSASKIINHWMNPNSDQASWLKAKSKKNSELKVVRSLVQPFFKDRDAFSVTGKVQTILANILQGNPEVDPKLLDESTEEILGRYGYGLDGESNFIESLLHGLSLSEVAPEVALAAVNWGLELRPDRPDAKFLRSVLRRNVALNLDDRNKRGTILKECLD
ncbi:MAG: hypothetical protein P1V97_19165, partial [Planctomycetota bacterium]|nr:hypothetical protein [Planctomycetota bacterium]